MPHPTFTTKPIMLGLLLLGLLTGCAAKPTVSEYQCRAGDWQTIGFKDGASGLQSTRLLHHQEACGAYSIVPERQDYLAGWREGLGTYCTADNGFYMGQQGHRLNSVCRAEHREPYASAYADGRRLFTARRGLQQAVQALANAEQRLEQIKQEFIGATTAQLMPDLTVEERVHLLAKVESLTEERAALKGDLPRLEQAVYDAESQLAFVEQSVASR